MKKNQTDSPKDNKLANKIAIIICVPFIIICGGYFIYHEYSMEKSLWGLVPMLGIFLFICFLYFLLKKGISPISIKIAIIVISAILLFLFN